MTARDASAERHGDAARGSREIAVGGGVFEGWHSALSRVGADPEITLPASPAVLSAAYVSWFVCQSPQL